MNSPFKFLDAYGLKDRQAFFGRDREIDDLYQLVTQNRLTFVYGPSGIGKTSLVQCGLANRFDGVDWLPVFVRRGDDLNISLRKEIGKQLGQRDVYEGDLSEAVNTLYKNYLRPVYLIFDQFEELFILGRDDDDEQERLPFFETIADLLDANLPCRILFIMREDYFGHLNLFERIIPELYSRKIRVESMSRDNLRSVIVGSCKVFKIGLDDEQRAPQLIIDNILAKKSGIHMPYVQVYLHMLYQEADKAGIFPIRFSDQVIRTVGPITDVLARFLREQKVLILKKLQGIPTFPAIPEDTVSQTLDVFVSGEGTKIPVGYTLLADNKVVLDRKAVKSLAPHLAKFEGDRTALISETVIELEKSRILRRSDDSFELAHDSLAALIDEQRSVEQRHLRDIRRRIETGYREHVDSGGAYFFDKGQLGRIEPFLSKLVLEPEQAEFLEKSQIEAARIDNVEKERAARELKLVEGKLLVEEQARKRQRYFTRLVAGVAIVALIAAVVAFIQQQRAKEALVKVEKGIIRDANNEIYHLRYGEAYEKLKSAAQIGQNKGETAHALLEVAFYYDESGHADKAKGPLDLAAALLGKPLNQGGVAALDPAYYGDLRKRYYPDMVEVKGGDTKIDGKAALISTFKIARTETTFFQFGLYTASVGLDIQQFSPVWGLDGDNPVVNVTWYHAARYANWLSKKTGMTKDTVYVFSEGIKDVKGNESIKKTNAKNYRLPSDIEWEYAARGGIKYDTSSYSGSADLASVAWFEKNSDSLKVKRTRQVNTRKANGLGLSDMTGNVWEWCDDWYEDYPAVFPADYRGAVKGEKRVFRGGGYTSDKEFCLISFRNAKEPQPSHPNYDLGFRLALQL